VIIQSGISGLRVGFNCVGFCGDHE